MKRLVIVRGLAACPVRWECLVDAITEDRWTVMGVWGGTTVRERTATLAALRARAPRGSPHEVRMQAAALLESTFPNVVKR